MIFQSRRDLGPASSRVAQDQPAAQCVSGVVVQLRKAEEGGAVRRNFALGERHKTTDVARRQKREKRPLVLSELPAQSREDHRGYRMQRSALSHQIAELTLRKRRWRATEPEHGACHG